MSSRTPSSADRARLSVFAPAALALIVGLVAGAGVASALPRSNAAIGTSIKVDSLRAVRFIAALRDADSVSCEQAVQMLGQDWRWNARDWRGPAVRDTALLREASSFTQRELKQPETLGGVDNSGQCRRSAFWYLRRAIL